MFADASPVRPRGDRCHADAAPVLETPPAAAPLRPVLAPGGERLVGAVGPLLASRGAEVLRAVGGLAGTRLVVCGDGPLRDRLALHLPDALFLGDLDERARGDVLAAVDVVVVPDPAASDDLLAAVVAACRRAVVVRDLLTPGPTALDAPDVRRVQPGAWGDLRAAVRAALTA